MLQSFFKIALRFLWRKKTYTILNFVCLTFGLTCAIIAMLYILNVFSYDKFHKNYERLYAVDAYVTFFNGDRFPKQYLSSSLTDLLKEHAPEIEQITRLASREYSFVNGDKTFTETGLYADSNFFSTFTFPVVQEGSNLMDDLNSVVISERMAVKFFGSDNCIGKTLIMKDDGRNESYKISGVIKDVPRQSLFQFDFVIPFSKFLADNSWALETGATANETWILLKNNTDREFVEKKIKDLIKNQETTLNQELFLFPLKEQILYRYAGGRRVWKEMQNIVIIGAIGLSILLIACFNFINLAVALNFRRYREAALKKVAGSGKAMIVLQFLGETFLVTIISLLFAVILTQIFLIGINKLFSYDINFHLLDIRTIIIISLIMFFTGLISGLMPALYLASSNPVNALKGKGIAGHSFSIFRQSLIVFQFAIPVALIICMMVIRTQDNFMRNYNAGIDRDRVIIIDNSEKIQSHAESVRAELTGIPGIDAVSFTNCIPTRGARVSNEISWEGKDPLEKLLVWCVSSDFDYNKTVDIKVTEGRFFNNAFSTDSTAYLINDVTARVMKIQNPVGASITFEGRKGTIIGVFREFHSIDLAGPLVPTIMQIDKNFKPTILVKYSSGSFREVTGRIKEIYSHYEPEIPFRATLFRDLTPYTDLSLPSRIVAIAFIIALLLACMGLFGLASFTAENRTKEIGIRKANGATTFSVMSLLLASYAKWLVISLLISLPVAFMFARMFLGRFHFHSPVPAWAFIAGPVIAFTVALLTVSSQTWKVADRNPVRSLRYE